MDDIKAAAIERLLAATLDAKATVAEPEPELELAQEKLPLLLEDEASSQLSETVRSREDGDAPEMGELTSASPPSDNDVDRDRAADTDRARNLGELTVVRMDSSGGWGFSLRLRCTVMLGMAAQVSAAAAKIKAPKSAQAEEVRTSRRKHKGSQSLTVQPGHWNDVHASQLAASQVGEQASERSIGRRAPSLPATTAYS